MMEIVSHVVTVTSTAMFPMSAEAWAAWAQAVITGIAILASGYMTRQQIKASEELRRKEERARVASVVSPLYLRARDLVETVERGVKWRSLLPEDSESHRIQMLDTLFDELGSAQNAIYDSIPLYVLQAKQAIEHELYAALVGLRDLNDSTLDLKTRMVWLENQVEKAKPYLLIIKSAADIPRQC